MHKINILLPHVPNICAPSSKSLSIETRILKIRYKLLEIYESMLLHMYNVRLFMILLSVLDYSKAYIVIVTLDSKSLNVHLLFFQITLMEFTM